MTTHLFAGELAEDGSGDVIVHSGITLCCKTWGAAKGDTGTIDPAAVTCPSFVRTSADTEGA